MSTAPEALRRDFGGDIIEPGDNSYDAASRTVLAAGSPGVRRATGRRRDVQAAVTFARDEGLALAVRSGGHGFAGFGTNEGGLVIDLGALADVDLVDDARHIVRIAGGATWGGSSTHSLPTASRSRRVTPGPSASAA